MIDQGCFITAPHLAASCLYSVRGGYCLAAEKRAQGNIYFLVSAHEKTHHNINLVKPTSRESISIYLHFHAATIVLDNNHHAWVPPEGWDGMGWINSFRVLPSPRKDNRADIVEVHTYTPRRFRAVTTTIVLHAGLTSLFLPAVRGGPFESHEAGGFNCFVCPSTVVAVVCRSQSEGGKSIAVLPIACPARKPSKADMHDA